MECNIEFPWLVSKSTAAYYMTCEKLFRESKAVYFWTFTFKEVLPDWWYAASWRVLMRDLGNRYRMPAPYRFPTFRGVRVLEPHASHGLHYHALIDQRIPIDLMQKLAAKVGMGWMWVVKCDVATVHYLAKYLAKGQRDKVKFYAKMHRWGTIGGFQGTRVRDIEINSPAANTMRYFAAEMGGQLPYHVACITYVWARTWGELWDWPWDELRKFGQHLHAVMGEKHAAYVYAFYAAAWKRATSRGHGFQRFRQLEHVDLTETPEVIKLIGNEKRSDDVVDVEPEPDCREYSEGPF